MSFLYKKGSSRYLFPIIVIIVIALAVFGYSKYNRTSQNSKIYNVGVLRYTPQVAGAEKGFFKGMEALGYTEGNNIHYIISAYGESPDKMQGLAQELINQKVDVIMAITNVAATGAKKAADASGLPDLPIVFAHASSPDVTGLIKSYKSSGNNLTGVAVDFVDITAKRLEFLQRIKPGIKRLGVLDATYTDPAGALVYSELKKVAPKFGITLVPYKVSSDVGPGATAEITAIASSIKPGDVDAFFYFPGPAINPPPIVQLIIAMSKRLNIPTVYNVQSQVELGGLFSYGQNQVAIGEQTAKFVDKVLRGQKPTDIPIEYGQKDTLILNLKTARESGFVFPNSMTSIAEITVDK